MTVKELIRRLKQYPPDRRVGVTMHDNTPDELQGFIFDVCDLHDGQDKEEHGDVVLLRT